MSQAPPISPTKRLARILKRGTRSIIIDAVCFSVMFTVYVALVDNNTPLWRFVQDKYKTQKVAHKTVSARHTSTESALNKSVSKLAPHGMNNEVIETEIQHNRAKSTEIPKLATSNVVASIVPLMPIKAQKAGTVPSPKDVTPIKTRHLNAPHAVHFEKRIVKGVPLYLTTIDLADPKCFLAIGLANEAPVANTQTKSYGNEAFASLLNRNRGSVVTNGTFFAKDDQKCVMGNMVSGGTFLKYSRWENYGTTLGLRSDNFPEMVTSRLTKQPDWSKHWFSVTCGPRLMCDGQIWSDPKYEGFTDDHVLGIGPRCAIGFPASRDRLYLVTFLNGLSLEAEANLMKALGCSDAMNLDGGASRALAHDGTIIVEPGRNLTNVLVVYDVKNPAPAELQKSWNDFQKTHHGDIEPATSAR